MSIFRGSTAIVGIGQTSFYKRGLSPEPELQLALRAIVAACDDAGIAPSSVDGFVSYGSERNEAQKLMPALGTRELRFGALAWSHGGGIPGALAIAASAIITGQAETVVVYRAMAERSHQRQRVAVSQDDIAAQHLVNGMDGPVQFCAMRLQRLIEGRGVPRSTMKAMVEAAYYHASNNPAAYGRNTVNVGDAYDNARLISEPVNLFDCSRENDAAAAVILVSADRARHMTDKPAFLLSVPMGAPAQWGALEENHHPYDSSGFIGLAQRMWNESGYRAEDIDVVQVYENVSGLGVGALIDHGFCTIENAAEIIRFENLIAPHGKLPINTSGGHLGEGFLHGMSLVPEAVRQIRGESTNQVPGASLSLMTGGPADTSVSTALFGSESTL